MNNRAIKLPAATVPASVHDIIGVLTEKNVEVVEVEKTRPWWAVKCRASHNVPVPQELKGARIAPCSVQRVHVYGNRRGVPIRLEVDIHD